MFSFLFPFSLKEDGAGTPCDKESTAIIKLNNTTVLYLKEATKFLALVCFVREESFERKGLIDYNFHCFWKAIHEVFEWEWKWWSCERFRMTAEEKRSHPQQDAEGAAVGDVSGTSFEIRCFNKAAALYCTKRRGGRGLGHKTYVCCKKKILPPFLLIFSFLNKISTLKQKLVY